LGMNVKELDLKKVIKKQEDSLKSWNIKMVEESWA
jgi:hypothetical protein